MKKNLLLYLFLFSFYCSNAQYDHLNINFLGLFDDPAVVPEQVYGIRYQACWGWADTATGKEYGIIGSTAGTYIVDVSNPTSPVQSDYIPHRQNDCIWHEYKTYGKYLYIISDDGGNNSFQIADLSYLPDSVHLVYDSTDIFIHAHTLFIDRDKLYVGYVTTATGTSSMNVYSLADPAHPTLLRRLDQDYSIIGAVHDMYVVNDTVYASCGYQGLYIFKYDTVANQFNQLGSIQDGFNIYNHSSVLSADHSILYVCEEVPDGQPVKIISVADIHNPALIDTFYSNSGATAHNVYVDHDKLIIAYYQDGVYIYDISNPVSPVMTGYFDTYMANPPGTYFVPAYAGCWSVYYELPSGILLAGDMQSGLFCLDISNVNSVEKPFSDKIKIYPNPATDLLKIQGVNKSTVEIFDMKGKLCKSVMNSEDNLTIDLSLFTEGIYNLKVTGNGFIVNKKIVKQ